MAKRFIVIVCAGLYGAPLLAQDNGVSARIGVGPQISPEYFGAEDSKTTPTGSFDLEYFRLGGRTFGGESTGLGFGGSVRFIGERSADDYDELAGLADIDPSLELGGGLRFNQPNYDLFADIRYGVVGHESLVAEIGGDVIFEPMDQLEFRAGPRILWGSDDYTDTYFGVTPDESAASAFAPYDPDAGIISRGINAEATYQFNDDWGLKGTLRYDLLTDDAADSPIVQSEDQITGSVVLTRKVTFGF